MRRKISRAEKIDFSDLPDLTPQQEKFVFAIERDGKSASDAYRLAYNCENMQPSTIWAAASRLFHDCKVIAWRSAIRRAKLGGVFADKAEWMKEVAALSQEAKESGNYGAALQGMKYIGDAHGHHSENVNVINNDPAAMLREIAALHPAIAAQLAAEHGLTDEPETEH